ncbi:MAG TPA: twin-arginine translocase TatA/TatE family subunit [Gaiellaceae bacterium]|nr:twin-arginine translocase TatA/TatE family subunit [Gaiellaceae bacterium]
MFGNMGFGEIAIILLVILLLFGAKRIPEIAGSFGKGIREFKKSVNEVGSSIRDDVPDARLDAPRREPRLGAEREPVARSDAEQQDRPAPKRLLS